MSLRSRLTIWYGLLLAVALLAFGSLLYVVLRGSLERQVDDALRLRAAQIGRGLEVGADAQLDPHDLPPGLLGPLSIDESVGPELSVQVLDQRAVLIGAAGSLLPLDPEPVLAALTGAESLTTLPLSSGRSVRLLTRPLQVGGRVVGVLQVGEALDQVETTLRRVREILTIGGLLVLAVALAGGWLLSGRALAPVRRVSALARRIARTGDYGQRLPGHRASDEVGELVATFNAMISRVEASLQEQRQFLADTSHELRSPLTVIRANLAFLWRDTDPDTRADCLRETEQEAGRMSRLVTDLLLLGQSGSAELLARAPLSLDGLVLEVAEQARAVGDGRPIDVGPLEQLQLVADRDRLKQLLWNLVENALRYTPASGAIRLSLRRVGELAELAVADEGPGIASEHLPRLFDRFYRVDRARSRATGGSGLGLAIVKHIAVAHGGSVEVSSQPGVGTRFVVHLPIETPTTDPGAAVLTSPASTLILRGVIQ